MAQGRKTPDELAAAVVAEASMSPDPRTVAQRHGISYRALQNYQKRELEDASFAKLCARLRRPLETSWKGEALAFLKKGIAKMSALTDKAESVEQLEHITAAVKVVGEIAVTLEVLHDDGPGHEGATVAEGTRPTPGAASPPN